jgi:hypothetical protein
MMTFFVNISNIDIFDTEVISVEKISVINSENYFQECFFSTHNETKQWFNLGLIYRFYLLSFTGFTSKVFK